MIELIGGGARSGKSRYALNRASEFSGQKIFVATATASDPDGEMAERIQRHKSERGPEWKLIEEPLYLSRVIRECDEDGIILIDCLTLYLSNWLCGSEASAWDHEKSAFLQALKKSSNPVLLVTNEVGMGVVPMGELSRRFVDESGWLHQDIAAVADRVTMVTFGLPQSLK